jgi:hypothetical protein
VVEAVRWSINIRSDNMETIKKGTRIIAKHKKSKHILHYTVIQEGDRSVYRLLNNESNFIMNTFSSRNPNDVIEYIEERLGCEIYGILNKTVDKNQK